MIAFEIVHHDPGASIVVLALGLLVAVTVARIFLRAWRDVDDDRLDAMAEEVAGRRAPSRIVTIPGGHVFDWHLDDPDVS